MDDQDVRTTAATAVTPTNVTDQDGAFAVANRDAPAERVSGNKRKKKKTEAP